jgi:DNA-directed RNA polymerase specialized sigma24 family protein
MTVHELSHRSREETARYLRREPYSDHFSFELFRRAIVDRDEAAWAAVYEQYSDIVRHWLSTAPEEAAEDIAATFARFWQAVDGAKFARFGSLSAILQYLKMCAHTVRIDRMRSLRARAHEGSLDEAAHAVPSGEDVEASTAARLDGAALWRAVQAALPDERERTVVRLSFIAGLTPRDICARYGNEFPEVTEVYRLKRNALERLGRAAVIKAFR